MAKYGEGDKRWIVEDRPDGTNVHNWHWVETDCLEWTRDYFTKSLTNLKILEGQGNIFITTKNLEKLEGEAYVNVRKGKVIPGYEISVKLSWVGEVKDDVDGKTLFKVDGWIELPYLSDENAGEDPEIKIGVRDDGDVGRRLKDAMVAKGKDVILKVVRGWVESMSKGGPVKDDLEAKRVKVDRVGAVKSSNENGVGKNGVVVENRDKKGKKGFREICLMERFNCRASDLFEILMDENRWKGFTMSNARISKEVGGEFSIFDGSVTGSNVELQEGKLIVQKWRFGSWPDGVHSTVRLVFDEPEPGLTVVKLTHSDVPEEDRYGNATVVENTERGWKDLIFNKIRVVFGFGV